VFRRLMLLFFMYLRRFFNLSPEADASDEGTEESETQEECERRDKCGEEEAEELLEIMRGSSSMLDADSSKSSLMQVGLGVWSLIERSKFLNGESTTKDVG
jgi:hypothetical protein